MIRDDANKYQRWKLALMSGQIINSADNSLLEIQVCINENSFYEHVLKLNFLGTDQL